MPNVWVAGAGMTRVGRRSEPLGDLMADAAHAALAAAGRERPDFIVVATMNPEEFVGDGNFASNIATYMGFAETPALRVETATSSGAAALYAGVAQVAAGLHRTVLVVGGEKMTHLPTPRVSEIIGRSIDPYERAYGATMPALAGLVTRALMVRRGVGAREIAQVAVKNHANAARNPYAHFQQAVTLEEVMESRMVADPLGLLPPGKAGRVTLDGETALDGRLPINPSGGLKARGHPLAATGLAQVVECVWQLTGRAGERQVSGRVGLAHSIGGLATNNWVTLVEKDAR